MARVSENNPEMQSSSSDFYIVHGSHYSDEDLEMEARNLGVTVTPEQREAYTTIGGYLDLDQQYTVFGEVIEGLDVVDKIADEKVFNTDKPLKKIPFTVSVIR
jgi:peptidyl-prolyl cis-trans isomerase B (cyclophilin B)